jgi:hypothetical protein
MATRERHYQCDISIVSIVRGRRVNWHARHARGKSIDLYLPARMAAQRIRVQCGAMDNAVIYGLWAVGSFAVLGAGLAFLVW